MSNEKMREEFEEAVLNGELLPCNSIVKLEGSDDYSSVLTGAAWLSWQISRAALCVELPLAFSDERATTYLTRVTNALDESGVNYK